jgi:hypothetical protein
VLVKLSSNVCDEATGTVAPAAFAAAMAQAAAQGLTLPQALPSRCWYALQQQQQPQQQVIGVSTVGVSAVASASAIGLSAGASVSAVVGSTSANAFDGLLSTGSFQVAQADRPRPAPTPIITAADPTTYSKPLASMPAADKGAVGVTSAPTECPSGTCPFLWGMNRIAMQGIWMQNGVTPFASGFTKRGTIIDTGVDYSHLDMVGMNSQLQVDKARSATFNRAENLPTQGASNLNLVSSSVTGHGTHVAGELHTCYVMHVLHC